MRSFRPMRPRREALPALVVMVLIALVGVLLTRGLSELIPEELFETEPFAGLTAEEVALDPATGLPIVPPLTGPEIVTWSAARPNSRVDATNTWASSVPGGTPDAAQPTVTLMATYPTHEAALAVAEELALAAGNPSAEVAWLEAAGVEAGNGFEWLGPDGSASPFVRVVDRRLFVDDLRWDTTYEPLVEQAASGTENDETDGQSASEAATDSGAGAEPSPVVQAEAGYGAPLALALAGSASSLLVEGDRDGEGVIAFDLVCIGDEDALVTLEQSLADLTDVVPMQPPWLDPPLTPEQERARRTQRLVTELWASAFVRDLMRSAELQPLSTDLEQALEAGEGEAITAAERALEARLAELVPAWLSDLGVLGESLDTDVLVSSLARHPARSQQLGSDELAAEAEALGASASGAPWADGSALFEVDADGRRLWVTQGSWFGIAEGYGPFVRYLAANGCDDIQVVFHDFDDVRPD